MAVRDMKSEYKVLKSRKICSVVAHGKNTDLLRSEASFNILQGGAVILGLRVSEFFEWCKNAKSAVIF